MTTMPMIMKRGSMSDMKTVDMNRCGRRNDCNTPCTCNRENTQGKCRGSSLRHRAQAGEQQWL
eukprot:scaffold330002_cov46-Prasinocladus_malaysianus.AAC.2